MGQKRYTDEQKREALAAAEQYIRNGWALKSIYRQLEAEWQAEGKEMISWWAFYPLAKAMLEELTEEGKNGDANQNGGNGGNGDAGTEAEERMPRNYTDGYGLERIGTENAGADGAAQASANLSDQSDVPAEDYTERLAMIVRLYRFRTEEDIDAVCDRLIPELTEVQR